MTLRNLMLATMATTASATKLLVSSYGDGATGAGTISTLELTPGLAEGQANRSASLKSVSTNSECGLLPTWLDLSLGGGKVICLDENWNSPNGSIISLEKSADGSLKKLSSALTLGGPVSTQFYNNNSAVAIAHYGGGAISTFKVSAEGAFTELQTITYGSENHGPTPDQLTAHVHEAIIDPTGQYLIFPDLGLDAVHVFCIDPKTGVLTAHDDIKSPAGSGPRHATFWASGNSTFLFVTHELANVVISYKVTYATAGGLSFEKVDTAGLYSANKTAPAPEGARAAEIFVSPDNKFVLASNRNVTLKSVPNPDPKNSTQIESDSLVTFKPSSDGKLEFVQIAPSGGKFPRHFSTNKDGSLVAVANQITLNVVVYARDTQTGQIGDKVAELYPLPGSTGTGLTNVRFVE